MMDDLKTNVIVENRAGAGGRIAAEMLKSAPADGSMLMLTPVVVPVLAPLVFSKLNYNAATDFAPVGHVCNFGFAITVPTALRCWAPWWATRSALAWTWCWRRWNRTKRARCA